MFLKLECQTYHMIMVTNFITISFRMLKKSTIILACSPIFPIAMPKAIKNPIKPVGKKWQGKKAPSKAVEFRKPLQLLSVSVLPAHPACSTAVAYTALQAL